MPRPGSRRRAGRRFASSQKYIDKDADFVSAVVTYDDPSETSVKYAPYRLTINGVLQSGGA